MTDANTNPGTAAQRTAGTTAEAMSVEEARSLAGSLIENVETVIVGNHAAIEHLVTAVLGRGHMILDDVPGVGKTMLARSVARSVDSTFKRVQFTPDLLPTDVTGVNVFNEQTREFEGFEARVIQHEIDHLNGRLFVERMDDMESLCFYEEYLRYLDEAE